VCRNAAVAGPMTIGKEDVERGLALMRRETGPTLNQFSTFKY
jgi:hypothetical protein